MVQSDIGRSEGLQKWAAENEKGLVLIVHGAAEHIGRYALVIQTFQSQGYTVYGGDLPGFGNSMGGQPGHVNRFEAYTDRVAKWWEWINEENDHDGKSVPCFILGHSMGGLIVANWLENGGTPHPAGLVLSSPCFGLAMKIPAWKEALSQILNGIAPGLRMPSGILPERLCRDQAIVEAHRADPLITKKLSVRWYRELLRGIADSQKLASQMPDIPLLVMQAGDDLIVDPEAGKAWFAKLPIPEKEYRRLPKLYHEIWNEPERADVLQTIIAWMDKIIEKRREFTES